MKKYSLFTIIIPLVVLVLFGFLYWQRKIENKNEKTAITDALVIKCKNGKIYSEKELLEKDIIQSIGKKIYYGEKLERLCNPSLDKYDYEAEPSFEIIPAYTEDI